MECAHLSPAGSARAGETGAEAQLQHRELWEELTALNARLRIRWTWIKGHNGHRDQSRADELAYVAARSLWVQQKLAA